MRWFAHEKSAAAEFADKYSSTRRDVPANGNDVRPSLDLGTFE
jgi:hypothetical protein